MQYKLALFFFLIVTLNSSQAQTSAAAQQLAQLQAQKMKDTVGISESKMQQIYAINMDILNRKQTARIQFANNPEEMKIKIQLYENQRDSLYHTIIISPQEYQLYKTKKKNILSAN